MEQGARYQIFDLFLLRRQIFYVLLIQREDIYVAPSLLFGGLDRNAGHWRQCAIAILDHVMRHNVVNFSCVSLDEFPYFARKGEQTLFEGREKTGVIKSDWAMIASLI